MGGNVWVGTIYLLNFNMSQGMTQIHYEVFLIPLTIVLLLFVLIKLSDRNKDYNKNLIGIGGYLILIASQLVLGVITNLMNLIVFGFDFALLIFALINILALYTFFSKKIEFKSIYIVLLICWASLYLKESGLPIFIAALLVSLVPITYILKSQRVKNTFIN